MTGTETVDPEETPEEAPADTAPDEAALLENYLQNTLIPQFGMMETDSWEWSGHNSESVDVSRINGILSAGIEDLDGDEQSELLLLRLESEGTASEVHLEAVSYTHLLAPTTIRGECSRDREPQPHRTGR